jgi:cytochrome c556
MSINSVRSGTIRWGMLVVCAALMIGAAGRANATATAAIVHARQDHFRMLGRTAKSLRDQMWRVEPDWNLVARDVSEIQRLAKALPTWFPAGSGQGHGVKTKASAVIWTKPQAFTQAAQRLMNDAQTLAQAAASHDVRALRVRERALGRACGSCHRQFRARRSWW